MKKTWYKDKNLALVVAGIVFSFVALMHLLRLFWHYRITIGGEVIPMGASLAGLLVALALAVWMFVASRN